MPQPIAKLAIVFYGIGFAFSLFKKVCIETRPLLLATKLRIQIAQLVLVQFLSLAIFLGLLGSGAYIFLRLQSGGENPDK